MQIIDDVDAGANRLGVVYDDLEPFPLLTIPLATPIPVQSPEFSVGDRVRISPELDIEKFRAKQVGHGGYKEEMAQV